jgi:hypothetical protein
VIFNGTWEGCRTFEILGVRQEGLKRMIPILFGRAVPRSYGVNLAGLDHERFKRIAMEFMKYEMIA